MKYKTAKVIAHPRSGSHYLAQLLNINFFHLPNYLPLYAGHGKHHLAHLKRPDTAVFYVHRNNEDSIKSMFVMRNRLGLVANSLEEFKNTKLSDMRSTNIKSEAIRNIPGIREEIDIVDTYLGQFNSTPGDYLNEHKEFWKSLLRQNYMCISYESLINNFDKTMLTIAKFLGSDKTAFIKDTTRVGWYDRNEPSRKFS